MSFIQKLIHANYHLPYRSFGDRSESSCDFAFLLSVRVGHSIAVPARLAKQKLEVESDGKTECEIKFQHRLSLIDLETGLPVGRTFLSRYIAPQSVAPVKAKLPAQAFKDHDVFARADVVFSEDVMMLTDIGDVGRVALLIEMIGGLAITNPQGEVILHETSIGWTANCFLFKAIADHVKGTKKLTVYPEPAIPAIFKLFQHTTSPKYIISSGITSGSQLSKISSKLRDPSSVVYCAMQALNAQPEELMKIGSVIPKNVFVSPHSTIAGVLDGCAKPMLSSFDWTAKAPPAEVSQILESCSDLPPAPGLHLYPIELEPVSLTICLQKTTFAGLADATDAVRTHFQQVHDGTSTRVLSRSVSFHVHNGLKSMSVRTQPLEGDVLSDDIRLTIPMHRHCFVLVTVEVGIETEVRSGPFNGTVTIVAAVFHPFNPRSAAPEHNVRPIWTAVTFVPLPLPEIAGTLHLPQSLCPTSVDVSAEVIHEPPPSARSRGHALTPGRPGPRPIQPGVPQSPLATMTPQAHRPAPPGRPDRSGLESIDPSTFASLSVTQSFFAPGAPGGPATAGGAEFNPTVHVKATVTVDSIRYVGPSRRVDQIRPVVQHDQPTLPADHDKYIEFDQRLKLVLRVGDIGSHSINGQFTVTCRPGTAVSVTGGDLSRRPLELHVSETAGHGRYPVILDLVDYRGYVIGRSLLYHGALRPFKGTSTVLFASTTGTVRQSSVISNALEAVVKISFTAEPDVPATSLPRPAGPLTLAAPVNLEAAGLGRVGVVGECEDQGSLLAMLARAGLPTFG